jgi:hypothetical protein
MKYEVGSKIAFLSGLAGQQPYLTRGKTAILRSIYSSKIKVRKEASEVNEIEQDGTMIIFLKY